MWDGTDGRRWGLELIGALFGLTLALLVLGMWGLLLVTIWPVKKGIDWWRGERIW